MINKAHPRFVHIQPDQQGQQPVNDSLFVYMASHDFREGLFDSVDSQFILDLCARRIVADTDLLMTIILPRNFNAADQELLDRKESDLKRAIAQFEVNIEFFHIPGRTINGLKAARQKLLHESTRYSRMFVWARNYFNTYAGAHVKKHIPQLRLHFDMLGLVPEEEFYYSSSSYVLRLIKLFVLKVIESKNVSGSDSISVVSQRMRELLQNKYPGGLPVVCVIPCLYNEKQFFVDESLREQYRNKYHFMDEQKVIVYSGMLQEWQKPDLIFSFIKKVQAQDNRNEFGYLILTYDQEKAHLLVKKYGLKNVIIESASGEVLNGLYNAADIGLAFRSDDPVSYVSSPVKIPEYLATGNSLVTLEYIGDYGRELKDKNYVLVKHDPAELLGTRLIELRQLQKPSQKDLVESREKYSSHTNMGVIRNIIRGGNE